MGDESLVEEGNENMSVADRIEALKAKHADLDSQLEDENGRPMPDAAMVATLKRQKLAIKDEIARLTHD